MLGIAKEILDRKPSKIFIQVIGSRKSSRRLFRTILLFARGRLEGFDSEIMNEIESVLLVY